MIIIPRRSLALFGVGAMLALGACGAEEAADVAESADLSAATALEVFNARMPVPNLVTAGQLTEEQFDGMIDAGYTNFISLRVSSENGAGWEEDHATDEHFDFDRLPISGADALTRENVEALAALLESSEGEPTVLYCGSSNRVGALLALKAFWVDGAEPEAAFELGQQAGMTGLTESVRELLGMEAGS